jgi:hypothetical protein
VTDHLKAVEPQFRVHGVDATVTVPDGAPVATRIIDWGRLASSPASGDMTLGALHREMSVRRDHVPAAPIGTKIAIVGGETVTVDGLVAEDLDVVRVAVV